MTRNDQFFAGKFMSCNLIANSLFFLKIVMRKQFFFLFFSLHKQKKIIKLKIMDSIW